MKKEILKEVLTILFEQKKEDDKIQKATNNLFDLIAPNSYAPILDSKAEIQLNILNYMLSDDILDWISYFLYEADTTCNITYDNKEYTISSEVEAINWLVNIFGEI